MNRKMWAMISNIFSPFDPVPPSLLDEWFVARFLSERQDGFDRLKPHLHHSCWREVVLFTAGCLRGDYATAFVQNILDAHSPFDSLLPRALALKHPRNHFLSVASWDGMGKSNRTLKQRC